MGQPGQRLPSRLPRNTLEERSLKRLLEWKSPEKKDLICKGSLAEGEAHYFTAVIYQSSDRVFNKIQRLVLSCKLIGKTSQRTYTLARNGHH